MSKLGKQNTKPGSAKSKSISINQNDYLPKKFGLKYDPPTIILEYLVPSKGKLYHHKMKLNKEHLGPYTLVDEVIEFLRDKHQMYLQHKKIQDNQLEALVERLQNHGKGTKPSTAASSNRPFSASSTTNSTKPFSTGKSNDFDPIGKGNASSSLSTTKPLGSMSSNTTSNTFGSSKLPDPPKTAPMSMNTFSSNNSAKTTAKPSLPPPKKEEPEDEYDGEVFEELDFEDDDPPPLKKSSLSNSTSMNKNPPPPAKKFEVPKYDEDNDFEELDDDVGNVDYQTFNLNKLSPEEAQLHKNKMNSTFSKNVKKPGDPGYEYDKVVDFKPANKESEWDEDL